MRKKALLGLVAALALLCIETAILASQKTPYDAKLQDILNVRISEAGLNFLAKLLGDGLLQPTLKKDIVAALEDQSFRVLVPNNLGGGYATFVVDYGTTSAHPQQDGFRYDDLNIELSTVPASTGFVPEAGVLYPRLNLNGFSGSFFVDQLPEIWLRVNYPPFVTEVSGVAGAKLTTAGVLRPFVGEGTVGFMVEEFDTVIFDLKIDFPFANLTTQVEEALGQAVQNQFSKELEDALSQVLQDGINGILFDRNRDATADALLNLQDLFNSLNQALDTDFAFKMEPKFQTNPTFPTTVLLRTDGAMFLNTVGDCVGADVNDGFDFTALELDGVAGHDPPQITEISPATDTAAQFIVTISDDFINQILFNGYRTGLACLFLNPLAPGMPTDIADLLTTESLGLFLGDWITDTFGIVPVGIRMRMLRAPKATILPSGDLQLNLHLPSVQIDLMVYEHERWIRLMGADAALDLAVGINNISLTDDEFIDATFSFNVVNKVNFIEFVPQHRETLEDLLPTVVALAESAVADILGQPAGDITTCVAGLDIAFFDLAPLAVDASGNFAHYLGMWLSLKGTLDLGVLFECLLGEPLVLTAETAAAPPVQWSEPLAIVPVLGSKSRQASQIVGAEVVKWRFVPGFYHRGSQPVPAIGFGTRVLEWQNVDGVVQRVRLVGGYEQPRFLAQRQDDRVIFKVATRIPLPTAKMHLELWQDGQLLQATNTASLSMAAADLKADAVLRYRDSWGRQSQVSAAELVPMRGGCGVGDPSASAVCLGLILCLGIGCLRRRMLCE